jgi:hypothetical protein
MERYVANALGGAELAGGRAAAAEGVAATERAAAAERAAATERAAAAATEAAEALAKQEKEEEEEEGVEMPPSYEAYLKAEALRAVHSGRLFKLCPKCGGWCEGLCRFLEKAGSLMQI